MATDPTAVTQVAPGPDSLVSTRQVIGERYEILGLLGSGGMGNVYKARDLELDDLCAVKVLRPEIASAPGILDRFRREVRLARRVTHPNVARVFDIGERGGEKILTMELIDGEPLSLLVARGGPLPVNRTVVIASAICAGLAAAHEAGVVHRDLKPDNVLLEKGGRVVITDFGIALAAAGGEASATASFVGTPAYMAPEQVVGDAPVDARADLYALGAMLFELCTGVRPWQGETVFAIAAARLLNPPPDPRALQPDLPPSLSSLILRCMARRPEDRYPSAAAVAADLAVLMPPQSPRHDGLQTAIPRPPPSLASLGVPAGAKRVAVLPFRNAGPPDQDYLADGLTEDVIDSLSMAPGLRVTSRGMVMRYKASDRDPREVGRELDVHVVVDGTVRRIPGGVRISARLASVADGVQLWARRFDRPDAEMLGASDDAARAIAEALAVDIATAPRPIEADAEALDLYLRARVAYHGFFSDLDGESSIPLFEQALARAPDDPRILAGYAMARARVPGPDGLVAPEAKDAAKRAVELAPTSSHAHLAVAVMAYRGGDPAEAVRSLRRSLRLMPSNVEAHDLMGRMLAETTLLTEARRHLQTVLLLEPDIVLARLSLARTHELLGERDEVNRIMEDVGGVPSVARLLLWRRDARHAAEVSANLQSTASSSRISGPILALAAGGDPPYEMFDRMANSPTVSRRQRDFFMQVIAEIAAFAGDRERALAAITHTSEGTNFDVAWIDRCPLFADLRAEPAFVVAHEKIAARAKRVEDAYRAPHES